MAEQPTNTTAIEPNNVVYQSDQMPIDQVASAQVSIDQRSTDQIPTDQITTDQIPNDQIPTSPLSSVPSNTELTQEYAGSYTAVDGSNDIHDVPAVIPMHHGLILAAIIFAIGLCGVMVRRNFLFMLMSLEIMMSAAALAFVVAGSRWVSPDGQIMFIFILTLAAAEASIGLAILLQFYHRRGHLDVDSANEMKG